MKAGTLQPLMLLLLYFEEAFQIVCDREYAAFSVLGSLGLPRNRGKAQALQHGMVAAMEKQPELIGYWDADLATPLDAFDEFLEVLDHKPGHRHRDRLGGVTQDRKRDLQ